MYEVISVERSKVLLPTFTVEEVYCIYKPFWIKVATLPMKLDDETGHGLPRWIEYP